MLIYAINDVFLDQSQLIYQNKMAKKYAFYWIYLETNKDTLISNCDECTITQNTKQNYS